jgi:hypothetical protein
MKSQPDLFEDQDNPMFEYLIEDVEGRVEAQAKFIIERHKIFLKKSQGRPPPWTKDPILQNYMFTNIYRELDRVTIWMKEHILDPYYDHPDLPFMMAIARVINWPETLQEMMDEKVWPDKRWNPDRVYKVLKGRANRKEKVITGAYIVNTVAPKGADVPDNSKPYGISYFNLNPLYENRHEFQDACRVKVGGSMTKAVAALSKHHGWGPFLANQVVVDMTYMDRWLKKAPDYNTFTSPGPGTVKGMNWMITGRMDGGVQGRKMNSEMIRFRDLVNLEVKRQLPKEAWTGNMTTGFEEISMSNYSNCNCETSKMVRSLKDGGANMKNKYKGT